MGKKRKESLKNFRLPWNVVDNKEQKMRKMRQMRIPWNVHENKCTYRFYPGMLLIDKAVRRSSGLRKNVREPVIPSVSEESRSEI
jgi:hypothetical protein